MLSLLAFNLTSFLTEKLETCHRRRISQKRAQHIPADFTVDAEVSCFHREQNPRQSPSQKHSEVGEV